MEAQRIQKQPQKQPKVTPKQNTEQTPKIRYRSTKWLLLIGCALTFSCSYIIISNHAATYVLGAEIHALERAIENKKNDNEALRLQALELSSPNRILQIAQEELGMTFLDQNVKVITNKE